MVVSLSVISLLVTDKLFVVLPLNFLNELPANRLFNQCSWTVCASLLSQSALVSIHMMSIIFQNNYSAIRTNLWNKLDKLQAWFEIPFLSVWFKTGKHKWIVLLLPIPQFSAFSDSSKLLLLLVIILCSTLITTSLTTRFPIQAKSTSQAVIFHLIQVLIFCHIWKVDSLLLQSEHKENISDKWTCSLLLQVLPIATRSSIFNNPNNALIMVGMPMFSITVILLLLISLEFNILNLNLELQFSKWLNVLLKHNGFVHNFPSRTSLNLKKSAIILSNSSISKILLSMISMIMMYLSSPALLISLLNFLKWLL